jgi:catechol 2,3-dioxygenase-like lactoylglutathione lyase family enzyme
MKLMIAGLLVGLCSSILICQDQQPEAVKQEQKDTREIRLGNFSVSLTVKDIQVSSEFYRKLGFRQVAGDLTQRWIVLQNGDSKVGLFQGMFEKNTLTFNPGWDANKNTLDDFDDVREIQKELIKSGIELSAKADESTDGPAYIALNDPDGNPILIDHHVARKK